MEKALTLSRITPTLHAIPPKRAVSMKTMTGFEMQFASEGLFLSIPPVCIGWLTENRVLSIAALIWKHSTEGCWNEITSKLVRNQIKSRCLLLRSCSAEVVVRLLEIERWTFEDKNEFWYLIGFILSDWVNMLPCVKVYLHCISWKERLENLSNSSIYKYP